MLKEEAGDVVCVEDVAEEDMPILPGPLIEPVLPGTSEVAWLGCGDAEMLDVAVAVNGCDIVVVPLSVVAEGKCVSFRRSALYERSGSPEDVVPVSLVDSASVCVIVGEGDVVFASVPVGVELEVVEESPPSSLLGLVEVPSSG